MGGIAKRVSSVAPVRSNVAHANMAIRGDVAFITFTMSSPLSPVQSPCQRPVARAGMAGPVISKSHIVMRGMRLWLHPTRTRRASRARWNVYLTEC